MPKFSTDDPKKSFDNLLDSAHNDFLRLSIQNEFESEKDVRASRHDWLIAIFGVIGGAVAGGMVSILVWLITRQ